MESPMGTRCIYGQWGCPGIFLPGQKDIHELDCGYKPSSCPNLTSNCTWHGTYRQLIPHLISGCRNSYETGEGKRVSYRLSDVFRKGNRNWMMMQFCLGRYFVITLHKIGNWAAKQYIISVQLVGTRLQAEYYQYRLELEKQGRITSFVGTPHCFFDEGYYALHNANCFTFHSEIADEFVINHYFYNITVEINYSMKYYMNWRGQQNSQTNAVS